MEQATSLLTEIFGWSIGISTIVAIAISALWAIYFNKIKEAQKAEFKEQIESQKAEFSKQLETLKAKNEKINYITKTQFDAEFKMYQELFQYSFQMFLTVKALFPLTGGTSVSNDNNVQKELAEQLFKNAAEAFMKFQEVLDKNAPFISKEIYLLFKNFKEENKLQINEYKALKIDSDEKMRLQYLEHVSENYDRTRELSNMHEELIEQLREYLQTLKIMDGTNE